jgi:hypothetical protein
MKVFDKIERVHHSKLKMADYNPRRMPERVMKQLKKSMLRWGFTIPVVADKKTGEVIGGHQRLAGLRQLITESAVADKEGIVPVIWRDDLSPSEVRKLNIALNKIDGEFDTDMLASLLTQIEELDGPVVFSDDVTSFGFEEDELKSLREALSITKDMTEGDDDPSLDRKSRKKDDFLVEPVKAIKVVMPSRLYEEVMERVYKVFGGSNGGAAIWKKYGGETIEGFTEQTAAIIAALQLALRTKVPTKEKKRTSAAA